MEEYELSEATLAKMAQADELAAKRIPYDEIIAKIKEDHAAAKPARNKLLKQKKDAVAELVTLGVSKKSAKFIVQLYDENEEEEE